MSDILATMIVKVLCPHCVHENLLTRQLFETMERIYCSACLEIIPLRPEGGHPAKRRKTKG